MNKIIKTSEGNTDFVLKEEFIDEDKAIKGKDPIASDIELQNLKIENIKYKIKEVLKDDSRTENFTSGKKA
mgnify:CR=1 FL=1